ncbi:MAG: hypothetical protein WAX80_01790 [Minisyncoccia bacterium]
MTKYFTGALVTIIVLVILFFALNSYIYKEKQGEGLAQDFKEVTFSISGVPVTLEDGVAEVKTSLGGDEMTTVRYFGNEAVQDIDGDGEDDMVFLITQDVSAGNKYFFLVGALKREGGYIGSQAVLIGDRIAPQTTEADEGRSVVVNYADRAPGEPITARPSVGKSLYLLLDIDTLEFGELVQNFEGESNGQALGQRVLNNGVLITPLEVISDSRCPVDVTCIWAGEVSVKVRLEKGAVIKEVILKSQTPFVFGDYSVSLTAVAPENNTQRPIAKEDYRFIFLVTPLVVQGTGTISGTVTTSPTCPVERMPPEPQCAPRPYATSIEIRQTGKISVLKTINSDASGKFGTNLPVGSYELRPVGGAVFPSCGSVTVQVKSGQNSVADISCDSGIR